VSFDIPESEKHHVVVRISIITPNYRSSAWLKLCLASIADKQAGVKHIVVDAGSDDGTLGLLLQDRRVKVFLEKAQGMYDAIHRGLRRASGEMVAYLNCGERSLSVSCVNDLPTAPKPVSGSRLA
jgi:glycosyltransferase involved in cell wall biosynthesis